MIYSGALQHGGGALHMLFQGFDIFGIHIQYWMLLAAVIAISAISYSTR